MLLFYCGYLYYISLYLHFLPNTHSRFRGNIMFLFMYSDYTNYVDLHTIIIIFHIY
jgi:hypothetical protein